MDEGIIDALAWIGIGDDDPAFEGPYFQSRRTPTLHLAAAAAAVRDGPRLLLRPVTRERDQGARTGVRASPGYDGYCRERGLAPAEGRALRFRTPDEGATVVLDKVRGERRVRQRRRSRTSCIARGDGSPVFLLANVVDDIEMRITPRRPRRGAPVRTPPSSSCSGRRWARPRRSGRTCRCIVNEQRQKLSKRRDKVALESYRAEGYLAEAMVNYLMTAGLGAER